MKECLLKIDMISHMAPNWLHWIPPIRPFRSSDRDIAFMNIVFNDLLPFDGYSVSEDR